MTYYVSAKSYAEQKEYLEGVHVVIIGANHTPVNEKKAAPNAKGDIRNRGKKRGNIR